MKWNELAELICAFISLFVTVIIGKKQSCQSKRMEELERRQDERDERRHAEGRAHGGTLRRGGYRPLPDGAHVL